MPQQPPISIILPLINNEMDISDFIDNILNQTLKSFELICIDGGSTDKTINIVKKYAEKDNRIKIYLSYKKSIGGLINHGFSIAKGKYITIVNCKDYLELDILKYLYDLTQINYIDIIQSNIITNNEKTISKNVSNEKAFKIANEPAFLDGSSIYGTIFKRSFLIHKKISFLENDETNFENLFFCESAIKSDTIKYTEKIGYHIKNADKPVENTFLSPKQLFNLLNINEKYNSNDVNTKRKIYDLLFKNMYIILRENNYSSEKLDYITCNYINKCLQKIDSNYVKNNFNEDEQFLYYKFRSPLILYHFEEKDKIEETI